MWLPLLVKTAEEPIASHVLADRIGDLFQKSNFPSLFGEYPPFCPPEIIWNTSENLSIIAIQEIKVVNLHHFMWACGGLLLNYYTTAV